MLEQILIAKVFNFGGICSNILELIVFIVGLNWFALVDPGYRLELDQM